MKYNSKYSVITFATNKLSYTEFALNCARSILLHNQIRIFIVSNLDFAIPADLQENVSIIKATEAHAELGIGMKLYIDNYLQTEHSLFIDADCLCFGSLDNIFEAAVNEDVTVAGNIVAAATWCGTEQAITIKKHFGLDELIRYNGGLYSIKRSVLTKNIFSKARAIAAEYDNYGFSRINGKWINEEGPLSIAMMLNKQRPVADNGLYMADLSTDRRPNDLNVLKGLANLKNPAMPSPIHRSWYPNKYSPVILHFGGNRIYSYPYYSQSTLLKLNSFRLPIWLSTFLVYVFIHIPFKVYYWIFNR